MVDIFNVKYWERFYIRDYDAINEYLNFIKSIKDIGDRDIEAHHYAYHHIVPRSFSEELKSESYNFIKLYHREHFVAHILLTKCFKGIYQHKMDRALFYMCNAIQKEYYEITPEEYELAVYNYSIMMSEVMSGENNHMYDVHLSGESNPMYGHEWTDEERKHMSDSITKWWSIQENRDKMHPDNRGEKNPFYNKHHTEETKKKISNKLKGRKRKGKFHCQKGELNPMYGKRGEDNPNFGRTHYTNGVEEVFKKPEEVVDLLEQGWIKGFLKNWDAIKPK